MSHYRGFECASHDPPIAMDRGQWMNHGEEELARLWSVRHHLQAVTAASEDIQLRHTFGMDLDWLAAHADCDIRIVSEYGETPSDPAEVCGRLGVGARATPEERRMLTAAEFRTAMDELTAALESGSFRFAGAGEPDPARRPPGRRPGSAAVMRAVTRFHWRCRLCGGDDGRRDGWTDAVAAAEAAAAHRCEPAPDTAWGATRGPTAT